MLKIVIRGFILYGIVLVTIYLLQDRLTFPAHSVNFDNLSVLQKNEEVVHLTTPDNITLEGLTIKPESAKDNILVFAGNAYDVVTLVRFLKNTYPNFNIIGFNYRGYGGSKGKPSEKALFADSLYIHDKMKEKFPAQNTYVLGLSIGTSVASYLAAKRDTKGLILIMPFDSINKIAKRKYPYLPVDLLLHHNFDTTSFIKNVKEPIAVISARKDMVVYKEQTTALKKLMNNLVYSKEFANATHSNILDQDGINLSFERAMSSIKNIN